MTFQADRVDAFLSLFDDISDEIRAFDGCRHLELWRDADEGNVLMTYSHWRDSEALDAYRKSELFLKTWTEARAFFAARPEAKSFELIRHPASPPETDCSSPPGTAS
jgi:quinol monooxygenase YgiN